MDSTEHCELVNKLSKKLYKKVAKLISEESSEIYDLEKVYNQELFYPMLLSMGMNMIVIALRHAIGKEIHCKEAVVERFMESLLQNL